MKKSKLHKLYDFFTKKSVEEVVPFEPYGIIIATDVLTVREGPGIKYKKVGVVKKGGSYTIIDEKQDANGETWGLLKAFRRERNGWIKTKYTQKK